MALSDLMKPKPLEYYHDLTSGGEFTVDLTQDEASIALKVYDYGVDCLTEDDKHQLHRLLFELKNQIWP